MSWLTREPLDYARWDHVQRQHVLRYQRYVDAHGLACQSCGGMGGETDVILDDGTGPWESCIWCEGTGQVTRWGRGRWLTWKQQEKTHGLRRTLMRQRAAKGQE